jgi:hypothetical protein
MAIVVQLRRDWPAARTLRGSGEVASPRLLALQSRR